MSDFAAGVLAAGIAAAGYFIGSGLHDLGEWLSRRSKDGQ